MLWVSCAHELLLFSWDGRFSQMGSCAFLRCPFFEESTFWVGMEFISYQGEVLFPCGNAVKWYFLTQPPLKKLSIRIGPNPRFCARFPCGI